MNWFEHFRGKIFEVEEEARIRKATTRQREREVQMRARAEEGQRLTIGQRQLMDILNISQVQSLFERINHGYLRRGGEVQILPPGHTPAGMRSWSNGEPGLARVSGSYWVNTEATQVIRLDCYQDPNFALIFTIEAEVFDQYRVGIEGNLTGVLYNAKKGNKRRKENSYAEYGHNFSSNRFAISNDAPTNIKDEISGSPGLLRTGTVNRSDLAGILEQFSCQAVYKAIKDNSSRH